MPKATHNAPDMTTSRHTHQLFDKKFFEPFFGHGAQMGKLQYPANATSLDSAYTVN